MKIGLLFSYGMSIEKWMETGLISRELTIYNKICDNKNIDNVYLFTYGPNDKKYVNKINNKKIKLVPAPKWVRNNLLLFIYSFFLYFFQKKQINKCNIIKTNQISASIPLFIIRLFSHSKIYVRSGYIPSKFHIKRKHILKYILYILIEIIVFKIAHAISVASIEDKNYILEKYKIENNKIYYIPNSINTNKFNISSSKKTKDIIFVGRLSIQKNIFNLIDAIKDHNWTLDIYGNGPLKEKIEEYIKFYNNIRVKGTISNNKLQKILPKYKLFILPSFYEGNPKALLEAMSCGLTCIGTNVEGIKEIIIHKNNGYLVDINSKSIYLGIKTLMNNKTLREKLGKNARKTIIGIYDLNKVINNELKLYRDIS